MEGRCYIYIIYIIGSLPLSFSFLLHSFFSVAFSSWPPYSSFSYLCLFLSINLISISLLYKVCSTIYSSLRKKKIFFRMEDYEPKNSGPAQEQQPENQKAGVCCPGDQEGEEGWQGHRTNPQRRKLPSIKAMQTRYQVRTLFSPPYKCKGIDVLSSLWHVNTLLVHRTLNSSVFPLSPSLR